MVPRRGALAHDVAQMTAGAYPGESGHLERVLLSVSCKRGAGFCLPGCRRPPEVSTKAIIETIPATFIRCQFVVRVCHSVVVTPARNDHRLPSTMSLRKRYGCPTLDCQVS